MGIRKKLPREPLFPQCMNAGYANIALTAMMAQDIFAYCGGIKFNRYMISAYGDSMKKEDIEKWIMELEENKEQNAEKIELLQKVKTLGIRTPGTHEIKFGESFFHDPYD